MPARRPLYGSGGDLIVFDATDFVPANLGGTGFVSYAAGDILYAATATTLAKLPVGGANTFLTGGTLPTWTSLTSGQITTALGFTPVNRAGDTLTGPLNENTGTAIASAGTINLNTATGNYVHITGTTAITAITLASGATRTVIFDASLTLTNGASLVLPGGINIITAANDIAIFRGDAGSVVRCVSYQRANGDRVVEGSALSGVTYNGSNQVTGYTKNGVTHVVSYPNATTITDVGGGRTVTATLNASGYITSITVSP